MRQDRGPGVVVVTIIGVIVAVLAAGCLALGYGVGKKGKPREVRVVVTSGREATVRIVDAMFGSGRVDELISFVSGKTRSRVVAATLTAASYDQRVSLGLAFGIGEVESHWIVGAVGAPNGDGSIDRGVMGLNSVTFRSLGEAVLDPRTNVREGVAHLATQFVRFGSWEAAVVAYNHGDDDRPPARTVAYLARVLEAEREFDGDLAAMFGQYGSE